MENIKMENNTMKEAFNKTFDQQMQERKEKAKLRSSLAKDKVCELMNTLTWNKAFNGMLNISPKIIITYSGSSDSGCIDYIELWSDEKVFLTRSVGYSHDELSIGFPEKSSLSEIEKENVMQNKTLNSLMVYLEDMIYDMLEERHGGWEINDGQEGQFTITFGDNFKDAHIEHEYEVFYSDSTTYNEEY